MTADRAASVPHGPPVLEPALRAVRWLPVALLGLAWAVGLATVDVLVARESLYRSGAPTVALLLMRVALVLRGERIRPGSPAMVVGFGVHAAVLFVAIWFNPLLSIYAFVGYFDAERLFRGRQLAVVLPVTALICAFGQSGGMPGVVGAPLLYVALFVLNLGVSSGLSYLGVQRERQLAVRERAAEELVRLHRQNVALQAELLDEARTRGIAEERARLSQEIHDTVAQGLVGVIRQLEVLPDDLTGEARERAVRAEQAARDCLVEARRAVQAMTPHQLSGATFVEALAELVGSWARSHRVVTELDADDAPDQVVHDHQLLRVAQEGLSNVARHAGAGSVRLRVHASGDQEVLELHDDGSGFDPDRVTRGHGLDGMAERLRTVGGSLEVCSEPGRGTVLIARAPRRPTLPSPTTVARR